ncbi:MAG: YbaB/EbfC family nucleoid-associated protein [Actinomycetes bacterium]
MADGHEPQDDDVVEGELVPGLPGGADLGAMLGGLDLGSMMEMAASMQDQMAAAQEQLAAATVEGTSGGGAVRLTLNGHLHLVGVHIDPSVADPADPTLLEDLVLAAWQDAHDQVAQLQAAADPLGGLGGGGLGGLLGGG